MAEIARQVIVAAPVDEVWAHLPLLLLLTETPAAAAPPHGAAWMTLNTYGFVPVDDVAGRWSRWWRTDVAAPPG